MSQRGGRSSTPTSVAERSRWLRGVAQMLEVNDRDQDDADDRRFYFGPVKRSSKTSAC